MSKNSVTIHKQPGTSTLVRPKFGPGMLLQHEDLGALNDYTRELSRLMFRSLFGYGVVCGLAVTAEVDNCNKVSVTVGAGLALGCSGDPVYVPKDQRFVLDENCYPDLPDKLWVILCGTTKNCAPRTSMCASDDDEPTSVCTRERDMFEIRVLSERPKCACGCDESTYPSPTDQTRNYCWCTDPIPDCHADYYAGKCGCTCGDGTNCDCEYILLARLDKVSKDGKEEWGVDHRVRRFIGPVLRRDPEAKPPEQLQHEAKKKAQYSSDVAAAKEELTIASNYAAVAGEAAANAVAQAKSAAVIQAEKLALAKVAADKLFEAEAATDSAKTAAEKKRTAMALEEASAAAALAKEEAEKATTEASAYETAWHKAVEEKLTRDKAVATATDRVAALAEELAMNLKNETMPPAGK